MSKNRRKDIVYMKENMLFAVNPDVNIIINFIKTIFLAILTYWSVLKILNKKNEFHNIYKYILIIITAIMCETLRYKINFAISRICLILLISIVFSIKEFDTSIVATMISFCLNYIFMILAIIIDIVFNLRSVQNNYVDLFAIITIYILITTSFFKIKKFKYGFSFLKKVKNNEDIKFLITSVSIVVFLMVILWQYGDGNLVEDLTKYYIICVILIIVDIRRFFQTDYKRNLTVKELEETKLELENKNKQIEEMEEEILSFNKKSHSIAHKQKALEYKLEKLKTNYEISEEIEIQSRVNNIKDEIAQNKADVELEKTNIPLIDDMFEFLKSECDKNNIELNLKIYENIYYMVNNIISKEELEVLIADHVKNAIIAINHSNNNNKSILIKLGKIDDYYGLYVYDSGVEFPEEILENLGKKAITTYANEGGSGMGFLNTFDTLRKYKASLAIEKIGRPSKDNFTKIVKIKFDDKSEYNVI